MTRKPEAAIENHLAALRRKRGLPASRLAKLAGVSRQTIYAMEAGSYAPNTAVALKLARALESSVEDLFTLVDAAPATPLAYAQTTLLPGSDSIEPGQPVQLCQVDKRVMASPPSPVSWYLPASDAIVSAKPGARGQTKVQVLHDGDFSRRLLIAGCDPGISVLARRVQSSGIELVLAHRNSTQALDLLKEGCVHIAGTHLRDEASGESNLPEISRLFPRNSVAVVSFAVWEEGIVTAPGNPKSLREIADLARPDVRIVNREPGAGSRRLLDSHLNKLRIDPRKVAGYQSVALGHLAAAWQVAKGQADACLATRAAARRLGLGFIPLLSERYDWAIRRQHIDLPAVQILLETLSQSSFRRELEGLGGYDARATGRQIL